MPWAPAHGTHFDGASFVGFGVSESVRIWGDGGRLPEDNYVRGGSVVLAWRRNLRHALIVPATHWVADFDALEHVAVD